MKGLNAKWSFRRPADSGDAGPLSNASLVDRVLWARGLEGTEADRFLDPSLKDLHDPSLLPDIDKAAARILEAAKSGESIVIYGDYDVDGITATAILFHVLKAVAPECSPRTYVPHRIDEGYGLNREAIVELTGGGARVIVSVDCGVTAVEPAREARERGVDVIITDHHNPPVSLADLPPAFAVVHPRRPDSAYPFGELSGAGVAYKLAWRIATMHTGGDRVSADLRRLLVDLLAFAALGTIADIVPLVGENRVLARFGLARVRSSPFTGLRALVEAAGLSESPIGELEVGFRLGPRLNAAGRMGHAREAIELFTIADERRAREIALKLTEQNEARRRTETVILEQASALAERAGMTGSGRRAIVLAHEEWNPGVVGIVCSRLVERFHRPAILMQSRGGLCQGSGRSVEGFNLHAGLAACSNLLTRFGGHNMAAGVHLLEPKLGAFTDAFVAHANSAIEPSDLCARVKIDCEASLDELTPDLVGSLEKLAPFGAGNSRVRVLVRGLRLAEKPTPMGNQGKHLSLRLRANDRGTDSKQVRAVGWNWGRHAASLHAGMVVDAVLSPKISTYGGSVAVEPEIDDLAPCSV